MDEVALKTPTNSTSPTAVFMTPLKNCPSFRCRKQRSLSFSTPPKKCCTSTENARSSTKRQESCLFSTPTSRKRKLVASPLTPKGQVRARFPKAPRLESQCDAPCFVPERKFPVLLPRKSIRVDFDHCGETTRGRRLTHPPLPNHTFRPVEVSESDFPFLPGRESFPVTPQVQGLQRTLPFLHFMCKESTQETRPVSLKMLSSQRRPSLLLTDW
jgi:hypothetical protein